MEMDRTTQIKNVSGAPDQKRGNDQFDGTNHKGDVMVNWRPPAPRTGMMGGWDKFVGPGATNAEEILQLVLGGLIGVGGVVLFWLARGDAASIWQWIFVLVLALDIGGGIVTNSTSAAKRWYHRAGHGKFKHLTFVAAHLLHIGFMAFLFSNNPLNYGLSLGGLLIGATFVLLWTPLYLQRPMAVGLAMLIIMVGQLPLFDIAGLNWFIPALMLKLILGHALKEAPFQPGDR